MSKKTYITLLWCASVLGVLCFIFANSLQAAPTSSEESQGFLDVLLVPFPWITHHTVRKLAHFAEYALLGAHFALAPFLLPVGARACFSFSALFGVLVAFLDEGIQRFVPGRGASLLDVAIDSLGHLVSFALLFFLLLLIQRRRKNA